MENNQKVLKKVLDNGLTVLVRPTHTIPKVSVQLWYNVGSKDEKTHQKGLAHLIEHMIFKGTHQLSESDINMITHKLSGNCNAFTSYDYTGYLFNFPSQNWHEALPIMADCMTNCTFKEDLLNSEMKAVIQELKMYRDNYVSALIEELVSTIFVDHPYHYPIIGFKQDLWNATRDDLLKFYAHHYVPNNATLVVVGDVDPNDVFKRAEQHFGPIAANPEYTKEEFYCKTDIISKNITLYREVQQPIVCIAFKIPGARARNDYVYDVLCWLLGLGKGARLYEKLVNHLQLVTEIETFTYDLFDHGLFFIYFQPTAAENIEHITQLISQEIQDIIDHGISDLALTRALKQAESSYLDMLESNEKQAYAIGQAYLATGDDQFIFTYPHYPKDQVTQVITHLLKEYMRPSLANTGIVLPLREQDKELATTCQEISDQEDAKILSRITRDTQVEPGLQVHTITTIAPKPFSYPKPQTCILSNGLKVLYYHNPNIEKIEAIFDLPAKHYHDPVDKVGLNNFMSAMLTEGTKRYTGSQLAQEIEGNGMSFSAIPGSIALDMLSGDLERGLDIFNEIVTASVFQSDAIEKVRTQLIAQLKNYWDQPGQFANQLARETIYENHPYAKPSLGTFETVAAISQDDLRTYYQNFLSPQGAVLALVGNLKEYDIPALLEKHLSWSGTPIAPIDFPPVTPVSSQEIIYPMNRDQIVLTFAGTSIRRTDAAYDSLLIFNQIFGGGALGSMSSRLFQLREQSGLFYTINGTLLSHADEQPGMSMVKTIVSLDRLDEAEKQITHTINTAADQIEDHELNEAKDALANTMVDNFATNANIANTFLYMQQFKLPIDYFDQRAQQLYVIDKETIQRAAQDILNTEHMVTIKIGRLS